MTIETWKEEFLGEITGAMSDMDRLLHSKRKYIGALPDNLAKHEVKLNHFWLQDAEPIFYSSNCALCAKYINDDCEDCPVNINDVKCIYYNSRWVEFGKTNDPIPCLDIINKIIATNNVT